MHPTGQPEALTVVPGGVLGQASRLYPPIDASLHTATPTAAHLNVAEAHELINYLLAPDVAAKNSNYLSYANGDNPKGEPLGLGQALQHRLADGVGHAR
jgi:hypothetical protein